MRHQNHFVGAGLIDDIDKLLHVVVESHARNISIRLPRLKAAKSHRFRIDAAGAQPVDRRFPNPAAHPGTRDKDDVCGLFRHDYTRPFSSSQSLAMSAAGNCSVTLRLFKETRSSGLIAAETSLMTSAALSSTLSLARGTTLDDKNKPLVSSNDTRLLDSMDGSAV